MESVWLLAAVWVGLAVVSTLLGNWLKISVALTEIVVGTVGSDDDRQCVLPATASVAAQARGTQLGV
ncbi:MAG: hypothetical protein WCC59_17460 [Terriglobales bacterium]